MVNFLSPGVYVIEKDVSDYAAALESSIVGIVGFASKGPTDEATLITSPQNLINVFGKPGQGLPGQGLEGAVEILEATNAIYFVRGTTSSALEASASIPLGGCPAVIVSSNEFGKTQDLYLNVQVTDNLGVSKFVTTKQYSIPSGTVSSTGTGTQGQALVKVIGNGLDQSHIGSVYDSNSSPSGYIFGTYAGSSCTLAITAYSDSARTTGVSALFALNGSGDPTGAIASSVVASGTTLYSGATNGVSYLVNSLYPGAGYNAGTLSNGNTSGNTIEITNLGFANSIFEVNEDGASKEQFKVSLLASSTWIEDVINTGTTNVTSEVIRGYLTSCLSDFSPTQLNWTDKLTTLGVASITGNYAGTVATYTPRFVKLIAGTYSLAGGTNGVSTDNDTNANALIGDPTVNPKTGIYALDDDSLNISIACAPGFSTQSLQNAGVSLAESSQNFIWLLSPAYGSIDTPQEAIDWSNGQSETRSAAINSSYAAIYWPWLQVYSVFDEVDKWLDPVIYAARQMCYTDSVSEAWFAPAGFVRGRLTKPLDVEVVLNQGDRDSLYGGGNVINPIVKFPQQGITIFGQRTAQRESSALDRVNIRRLLIVLRKLLLASARRFVFEPNDIITWERVKVLAESILDDIRRRRGVTDFKVVCDETTNTPARIDRNELWCKVVIIPTKAAEAIVFEINVTSNSAKLGS